MSLFTCPNSTTEFLVAASQRTIKLLRYLELDPKYPSDGVRKIIRTLKDCQSNYLLHRRSYCDHPLCPICQGKKRPKLRARLDSALLTYLLGDPLNQDPLEAIESRSIVELTITLRDCEPKDIRSTFDLFNSALVTLHKRESFPIKGYFWINENTINKDPNSLYFGYCHPHRHELLAIDTSDPKAKLFWEQDQKDIDEYLRRALKKIMKLDYLPEIKCQTVLTGSEVSNLTTRMYFTGCTTLDQYSKYIKKDPQSAYSSPITEQSNTFATASYHTKQASKALMVPDDTISLDRQKEITYHIHTDLPDGKLYGSGGSLTLPNKPNIKTIEDFIYPDDLIA